MFPRCEVCPRSGRLLVQIRTYPDKNGKTRVYQNVIRCNRHSKVDSNTHYEGRTIENGGLPDVT